MERLERIRLRMAGWYAISTISLFLTLGFALFTLLMRERSHELDGSLREATLEVVRTAGVISVRELSADHIAATAVDELSTRELPLYLFSSDGVYHGDTPPPPPIAAAARKALIQGQASSTFRWNSQSWRVMAQALRIRHHDFAVVAVADESVLDGVYFRTLLMFVAVFLGGLLLLGALTYHFSGWAIQPIEANVHAMRRFMADAAHELRTPMSALRVHAEVALEQEKVDGAASAALQRIVAESGRMSVLIGDLLTLARADAGEPARARTKIYFDDVVSDALATASAAARRKGVALLHERYEEAAVLGDDQLLHQLLLIILDNAIKYTPAGGKIVTQVFRQNRDAVVVIHDSGAGIDGDTLPRIFDRFYRGEAARASTPGSGLGLSIARWIVDQHGGTIVVESQPGHGTRVEIRLPGAV